VHIGVDESFAGVHAGAGSVGADVLADIQAELEPLGDFFIKLTHPLHHFGSLGSRATFTFVNPLVILDARLGHRAADDRFVWFVLILDGAADGHRLPCPYHVMRLATAKCLQLFHGYAKACRGIEQILVGARQDPVPRFAVFKIHQSVGNLMQETVHHETHAKLRSPFDVYTDNLLVVVAVAVPPGKPPELQLPILEPAQIHHPP
jgi:hypothetical protein